MLIELTVKMLNESKENWIYGLFLVHDNELLPHCYIGQTKNIRRRLNEHKRNSRRGKGSFYLHELAEAGGGKVCVLILERLTCDRNTIDELEAVWIQSALEQGFSIPGINNWIKYNDNIRTVKRRIEINKKSILKMSAPLDIVVDGLAPFLIKEDLKEIGTGND